MSDNTLNPMESKTVKSILDFDACPHCGSDFGYYTRAYVSGWVKDRTLFETREPYNPEMHDHLTYSRETKYYFCDSCDKRICKV